VAIIRNRAICWQSSIGESAMLDWK